MNAYIKTPCILLAVGFCGSGKSIALQYCIKTIEAFDFVVILSNTAHFNGDYSFLKDMGIRHRIYSATKCVPVFKKIMEIQEKARKEGSMERVCIVADDCLGSLTNSKTFLKLSSTYRHFGVSLFLTSQFVNSSMTYIRELANYCFIFNQRTESSRKAIYQSYFGDVGTFTDFKKIFEGLKAYQFFFIDRPSKKRFKFIVPYKVEKKEEEIDEKEEFIKQFD